MTPQERQLLESFANRIAATDAPAKDAEAEALIRSTIGAKPDALYILTQTALVQEIALNQANARLHQLQKEIDSHRGETAPQPTSFLGRLFGLGGQPSSRPANYPPPGYAQPGYAPQPYPPPYDAPPQYYGAPPPSAGSSFLRSAAATATGVAAGALAFEGIESLFGHYGDRGSGFLGEQPSETIVNNYYDEPRGEERGGDSFFTPGGMDSGQYDDSTNDMSNASDDSSSFDSGDSGDDYSSSDV